MFLAYYAIHPVSILISRANDVDIVLRQIGTRQLFIFIYFRNINAVRLIDFLDIEGNQTLFKSWVEENQGRILVQNDLVMLSCSY